MIDVSAVIDEDRNLIASTSITKFMRQRVIFGECRMLTSVQHVNLREEIATHFGVHTNEVVVVGSAKLGYSVSPQKKLKGFDDKSDLDIAIVNSALFEKYWQEMLLAKKTMVDWPDLSQAQKYLFQGWIRPDKLPNARIRNEWFDFFTDLHGRRTGGPYPVRAGLYYSISFLESYQEYGIRKSFERFD